MYGRTLAPEFRISYRHTEYTCIFREAKYSLYTFAIVLLVKNKTIKIIVVSLNPQIDKYINATFQKIIY